MARIDLRDPRGHHGERLIWKGDPPSRRQLAKLGWWCSLTRAQRDAAWFFVELWWNRGLLEGRSGALLELRRKARKPPARKGK